VSEQGQTLSHLCVAVAHAEICSYSLIVKLVATQDVPLHANQPIHGYVNFEKLETFQLSKHAMYASGLKR